VSFLKLYSIKFTQKKVICKIFAFLFFCCWCCCYYCWNYLMLL